MHAKAHSIFIKWAIFIFETLFFDIYYYIGFQAFIFIWFFFFFNSEDNTDEDDCDETTHLLIWQI